MPETEIVFTCPKCGEHAIEEIMVDVIVSSEVWITAHDPGGIVTTYGQQTNDDGHVDRYQCGSCGFL